MSEKHRMITSLIITTLVFVTGCTKTKVEIIDSPTPKTVSSKKPTIKVFLENSGSMDGFMCDGSELKDGIYNYLTSIKDKSSKMELFYINSDTKRQNVSLSQYIRNLNPTSFKNAGGNRSFTDIPDLLSRVLKSVDDNSVAIYISDCILDIPNKAAPDFLYITRTDIHSVFGDKIKQMGNLSVCIYQIESTFNGLFFFPKGGSQFYNGKLPYYMFVIGSNDNIATLRRNVSDTQITHGFKNYCAFSPEFVAPATFSQGHKYKNTTELKSSRGGRFCFSVQTDLSLSLQNDKVLTNPQNYSLTSNKIKIEKISPIKVKDSEYSHVIAFSIIDEAFGNMVTLNRIAMPTWVKDSNDKQGVSISPNKTFGIEFIIGGISDAFIGKFSAIFKLNIKKQ